MKTKAEKGLKPKRFVSLNIKVLILTFITATIPIAIIGTMLYVKSVDIVIQKQNVSSLNSLNNIFQNIEGIMDNAHNLSLLLIQDDNVCALMLSEAPNNNKAIEKKLEVTRTMAFYLGQKNYIDSIYLMNNNISLYNGFNSTSIINMDEKTLQLADKLKGGALWMIDQVYIKLENKSHNTISLIRNINNIQNPKQKLGVIRINIMESSFLDLFQDDIDAFGGDIYLIDENDRIISSSDREMVNQTCPQALVDGTLRGNTARIKLGGIERLVYFKNLSKVPWRLVTILPLKNVLLESNVVMEILIIGIITSLILCFFISVSVSRSILDPLRRLAAQMRNLKKNNYIVNLTLQSNDEIGLLYTSFNEMSSKLNELINEVFIEKLHQEEAELKALQAQLNPHFLYNNLDSAYWMSRMERAPKTGKVIMALSNLYKLSLRTGTQFISVKDEIEHIKNYIVIQRIRFEESIQFCVDISRDTEQMGTTRFILQPLVENAITHGLLPTGRNGQINVRIFIEKGELLFTVEDDGVGANVEEITSFLENTGSTEARGLAIRNVHQRIQLRYGSQYGLAFSKNSSGGFTITVRQPAMPYDRKKAKKEKDMPFSFNTSYRKE